MGDPTLVTHDRLLAEKFAKQSRHYLANATRLSKEIRGIDKAGELVWGALILALKAVGAARRRRITRYGEALKFAKEIIPSEMVTVGAIKGLHGQFYEGEVSAEIFHATKDSAEILIDDLLSTEGL